jgi:hypothetical protein
MSTTCSNPAAFRSLYRIMRRAASSSVLHHSGASKNVRRMYRQVFERASRKIANGASDEWIAEFDTRSELHLIPYRGMARSDDLQSPVNRTLMFLYSSSICPNIAHKFTESAAFIQSKTIRDTQLRAPTRRLVRWDPKNPKDALYQHQKANKTSSSSRNRVIDSNLDTVLQNARTMAEGMGRLILGR